MGKRPKSTARSRRAQYGHFTGDVVAIWLIDPGPDRTMKLVRPFSYTTPDDIVWRAQRNRTIDGASIPSLFWGPLIGSPYTGDFRRASVVHDIACQDKPYT